MRPRLRQFAFRLRHARAIRRETVALYLEHGTGAAAVAAGFARDPAASPIQRLLYVQVSTNAARLAENMKHLDTATRYLEHDRLEHEYARTREAGGTRISIETHRLSDHRSGSDVE